MRNACDSDSRCGLACDASTRDAKSLALWVERCEPLSMGPSPTSTSRKHRKQLGEGSEKPTRDRERVRKRFETVLKRFPIQVQKRFLASDTWHPERVPKRFRKGSRTVFEPFSNPFRKFEPFSNPFRTLFEPFSNPFRTVLEPFSNPFRTLFEPFSKIRTVFEPFRDLSVGCFQGWRNDSAQPTRVRPDSGDVRQGGLAKGCLENGVISPDFPKSLYGWFWRENNFHPFFSPRSLGRALGKNLGWKPLIFPMVSFGLVIDKSSHPAMVKGSRRQPDGKKRVLRRVILLEKGSHWQPHSKKRVLARVWILDTGLGKGPKRGPKNSFRRKRVTLSKTPLMLPKNLSMLRSLPLFPPQAGPCSESGGVSFRGIVRGQKSTSTFST